MTRPQARILELSAELQVSRDRIAALEAENAQLVSAIERDRSTLADFITALKHEMDSRFWLTEGRGSYEWNDDRYRQEFHDAAVSLLAAIKPLEKMAADLTNSPRESAKVRDARRDLEAEVAKLTRERDYFQSEWQTAVRQKHEIAAERDTYYAQTLIDAGHEATIARLTQERDAAQFRAALKLVQGACQDELSTREIWAIAFQGLHGHAPEDTLDAARKAGA